MERSHRPAPGHQLAKAPARRSERRGWPRLFQARPILISLQTVRRTPRKALAALQSPAGLPSPTFRRLCSLASPRLYPLNPSSLSSLAAGRGLRGGWTVSSGGESLELAEDLYFSPRMATVLRCDLRRVPSPLWVGLVGLRLICAWSSRSWQVP